MFIREFQEATLSRKVRRKAHGTETHSDSTIYVLTEPGAMPLRARVARMRSIHRAELAEMAERTRLERQAFVQQIHTDITQRLMPEVAELRAAFRAEHQEMSERTRLERQAFVNSVRAWVG